MLTISGSGDLTLQADGTLYVDFSQTSLSQLRITVDSSITLGADGFPASLSDPFDTTSIYAGLTGTQSFTFPVPNGDVVLESFDWSGNLTIVAANFFGAGSIVATDSIILSASSVLIGGGAGFPTMGAGGNCPPGTRAVGSGSAFFSGTSMPTSAICIPDAVTSPPLVPPLGGRITIVPGPMAAAVPEPGAAILFAAGFAVCLIRRGGNPDRTKTSRRCAERDASDDRDGHSYLLS